MKEIRVLIKYQDGEPFDIELETAIKKTIESLGFFWWAQGYNLSTGWRNICFDEREGRLWYGE